MKFHITLFTLCLLFFATVSVHAQDIYGRGNPVAEADILPEGQVRAVVIENESQLIGGPKTEGVVGDFKLYNNRAAFVIAGVRPASGINPLGGVVEDAGVLVRDAHGAYWYNLMGDSYLVFAKADDDPLMTGRLFAPIKAEVLKDGSDGEAIVRVVGRDAEFQMRKEQYGLSSKKLKILIAVDYILRADSPVLETKVSIKTQDNTMNLLVGMVFLMGDGADVMAPGAGYDIGGAEGKPISFLSATSGAVSYGWFTPGSDITIFSRFDKMIITALGTVTASPDGADSLSLLLATGSGDTASVLDEKYSVENNSDTGTLSGMCVLSSSNEPAAGATAHIFTANDKYFSYFSNVLCGADGTFTATLPSGDYIIRASYFGLPGSEPVRVAVSKNNETKTSVNVEAPASIEFEVADQNGKNIPVTISLKAKNETPDPLDKFLTDKRKRRGMTTHFSGTGTGSISTPPGGYDVYFSRGLEYEYVAKSIKLKSGGTVSESIVLEHVVDTTGYLSGDFHIHAAPSFDSDDTIQDKLLGIAATGLEVPVSTDHNTRTDYTPIIEELGLQDVLKSIIGTELTTTKLGHFNAYPLTYKPAEPNHGAIDWIGMSPDEIFESLHADNDRNNVVQVNHPFGTDGGYLTFMGYNAETATAGRKDFSRNFDAMEILNGGGYKNSLKSRAWWFSFLDRGFLVTGVGNSDSHGVFSLEVGYPRNYVKSETDNPGDLDTDTFIKNVHAQNITVSGGPFILMNANEAGGMGDTVTDTDGSTDLNIRIQAPSWMSVNSLKIYSTQGLVETITIEDSKNIERFNGTIKVDVPQDTWFIAIAEGEGNLFPVYPGKHPFAFTNPIYIDKNGNKKYDPPKSWE